ncbi:FaeA/PapI family transcriptional regulator [Halegenticoccus tardaugens]|uniref:FaeA/PapI family transcriptional regulator n=1 Tax=Halegenticoccus tardaugens TaxID=2071624 RepID=UPI001E539B38|nr:HTH domain-containing protein [Halegenticoccus tardaugens]
MVNYQWFQFMRMSRSRGDDGRYIEKATIDDVIAVLTERDEPLTGKEVGEELGISNRSALDKLNSLEEKGNVERKKVGAGAVVWWLSDEQRARGGPVGPLFDLVGLFGDDDEAAERSRKRSEEWGEEFDQQMLSGIDEA